MKTAKTNLVKLLYYPGCTLRSKAIALDASARGTAAVLGIELVELADFTCCGGLFPQISENLMPLLAPARVLVHAQRAGGDGRLMTLCSFCYNTLKRANKTLIEDGQKRATVSEYLEEPYKAQVKVVHLLEVLRDDIGYDVVRKKVRNKLDGLRIAPYYGCLLLRPAKELALDDPEEPTIMEDLFAALGCEVVDFPSKTECCGSFLRVSRPELATDCSQRLLKMAGRLGVDALVTSCPLCHFNLTRANSASRQSSKTVSILYFTQLLGHALGIDSQSLGLQHESLKPIPA